jgi:flagella basal body P-ring formation protein FlgA
MRTRVAVPVQPLPRGTTIQEADFTVRELWLPPSRHRTVATPAELVGQITKRTLAADEPIRRPQVETPHVIDRGDRITVRCLVGGVAISLQAEAREAGGIGATIECRKLGERRSFRATVAGPGLAVFDLSNADTDRSPQQAQRQPQLGGASS